MSYNGLFEDCLKYLLKIEDAGMAYAVFDTEVIAGHGTNVLIKSRTKNKNDLNEYLKARNGFHNEKVAESKKDTNPNKKDQTKYADGWSNRLELIKKAAKG